MDINWKFFDMRVCLTTGQAQWNGIRPEFDRVGIDVKPFYALPGNTSFESFNRSEQAIIKSFLKSGHNTLLHLEDDAVFKDYSHLNQAISELPAYWDILYLGANLCGSDQTNWPKPKRFSQHLFRVTHAWTTHAIAYRRNVAEFIQMDYDSEKDGMYDDYLTRKVLHKFNAYVVSPMIVWQRPRHSELWQRFVDYDGCYSQSQNRMEL